MAFHASDLEPRHIAGIPKKLLLVLGVLCQASARRLLVREACAPGSAQTCGFKAEYTRDTVQPLPEQNGQKGVSRNKHHSGTIPQRLDNTREQHGSVDTVDLTMRETLAWQTHTLEIVLHARSKVDPRRVVGESMRPESFIPALQVRIEMRGKVLKGVVLESLNEPLNGRGFRSYPAGDQSTEVQKPAVRMVGDRPDHVVRRQCG